MKRWLRGRNNPTDEPLDDDYSPWIFRCRDHQTDHMGYSHLELAWLRNVGAQIRRHRLVKGFTQEELALDCGLDRSYVGQVERGEKNIAIINLKKMTDSLGVDISELFRDIDSTEENR